jgi:uncharacterized protein (DUF305 family)
MRLAHLALLVALSGTGPALAQDAMPHHDMTGMHGAMQGMQGMQEQMDEVPMTGDADIDFATMMIPHHQGAIDMAEAELAHGKDPELRKLAQEIIAAQKREIAFLEQWLQKRGD